jgi:hypothetical protein
MENMSEEEQFTVDTTESLSTRLNQYSIINAVCQGYVSLKEKNAYIKAGLETAENLTQPVLKKLDDKLHLDDKGVAILDKIETTAHGITSTASNYYTAYQNKKENALEVTHSLINTANRPVNYLLDYTESLLDRALPPHQEVITPIEMDTEDDDSFIDSTEGETTLLIENPITRIKRITLSMPQRLAHFKSEKIIPLQTETVGYATELLKYAYERIDVEGKKSLIYENTSSVHKKLEEKSEEILKLVNAAKEILHNQTDDIKDKSIQALVTSVSAIAHVSEIIRRQLTGRIVDPEKLQAHLSEVTRLTKIAIEKLKENELRGYVQKFKETSLITIQALIDITYAYTPEKFIPLLNQLSKISPVKSQKEEGTEQKTDST